jgi:hypothetical protein
MKPLFRYYGAPASQQRQETSGFSTSKSVEFSFGCLQGIQLSVSLFAAFLNVRCHAAFADAPFSGGVRKDKAIFAGGKFLGFLAAFTLLDDMVAGASVELAPLLAHEKAIQSFFHACTNPGYHILSL